MVTRALCALERCSEDGAFVIFTHEPSGKFVQFAGGAGHPLLLDLPSQVLSEDEWERAIEFFRRFGVDVSEYEGTDRPAGGPAGHVSFNVEFDSVNLAAQTALDVLQTIFELPPDCELTVEES
ncbi:MAG: hypothetical protein C4547_11015 [Phycisphaerales bacterium]|nr:MAG: hypothetical protein C4547_11015 [Phycisphaerales bacterium]